MKRILGGITVVVLLPVAAFAADLPARGFIAKAPMMGPTTNWSGLYIGGNAGYGWGNGDTGFTPLPTAAAFATLAPTTLDPKPKGITGGAQIGYNWQIGSIVTGFEADVQGSGFDDSVRRSPFLSNFGLLGSDRDFLSASETLHWFGTVRGRLGVTVTPDLLLYATGGLAYGQIDVAASTNFASASVQYTASSSTTKTGWVAGAGAEWMFARNWSAKLEYLYMDLGNMSAIADKAPTPSPPFQVGYTWKTQENIVRAGVNYHF